MNKKILFIALTLTTLIFSGCDMLKKKGQISHPDPNGSKSEQRAYHQNEINKYQMAKDNEKKASIKSLQSRDMDEVRRSNDKQIRYERKIQEHQQAIDDLEGDDGSYE
jgi:hypothetical protein